MEATLADGRKLEVAGVLASAEDDDLALLRVPDVEVPALTLASPGSVEPGDRIVILGNPLGLSGTVSDGLVAALRPAGLGSDSQFFADTPLLQVTAPVSPGSSGSPVLDGGGEVVGVAVGAMVYGQNLNFAIPTSSLVDLLGRADLASLERPFSVPGAPGDGSAWPLVRNLAISAVFFAGIWLAFRLMKD
jgi:S1-C subfamily serine protease